MRAVSGRVSVVSESKAIRTCQSAGILGRVGKCPAVGTYIVPESRKVGERREGKHASY
jgi:hypothetical protein